MVESSHVGFLRHITGEWVIQQANGSWETSAAEEVLQAVGMQSVVTYIGRCQAKVAQWVALRPILEVCVWKTAYEGGDRKRRQWWKKGETAEALRTTL